MLLVNQIPLVPEYIWENMKQKCCVKTEAGGKERYYLILQPKKGFFECVSVGLKGKAGKCL